MQGDHLDGRILMADRIIVQDMTAWHSCVGNEMPGLARRQSQDGPFYATILSLQQTLLK